MNEKLVRKSKVDLGADARGRDWVPFDDLEQSVVDGVEILRQSKLIPPNHPDIQSRI